MPESAHQLAVKALGKLADHEKDCAEQWGATRVEIREIKKMLDEVMIGGMLNNDYVLHKDYVHNAYNTKNKRGNVLFWGGLLHQQQQ